MDNTMKKPEIMKPTNVELLQIKMDQVALQSVEDQEAGQTI